FRATVERPPPGAALLPGSGRDARRSGRVASLPARTGRRLLSPLQSPSLPHPDHRSFRQLRPDRGHRRELSGAPRSPAMQRCPRPQAPTEIVPRSPLTTASAAVLGFRPLPSPPPTVARFRLAPSLASRPAPFPPTPPGPP